MISLGDLTTAGLWVTTVETAKVVTDPYLSRWGVSIHYHPEFTESQIRALTQDQAVTVLTSTQYWPTSWSGLPQYLATPLLAFSVLEGPTQAARALQSALGVKADGDIGPQTCAAANSANALDPLNGLLRRNFQAQVRRMQESSRWLVDGAGWCGRQAAAMAAGAIVVAKAAT